MKKYIGIFLLVFNLFSAIWTLYVVNWFACLEGVRCAVFYLWQSPHYRFWAPVFVINVFLLISIGLSSFYLLGWRFTPRWSKIIFLLSLLPFIAEILIIVLQ